MDEVGRAYATVADRYVELFGHTSSVHPDDLALIERHLTIPMGTVLDVGCGPGHLGAHLSARGAHTIGLDIVPAFIEHARAAHELGGFVLGSLRQIPIRDVAASGILAWYSLIHLLPTELDDVLAELRRIAAPGATMVVGFFVGDEIAEFPHRVTAAHRWPADELASRLARVGFREVDREERPGDVETDARPHAAIVAVAD